MAALYQPLKRLATIVTPRWGFVLQPFFKREASQSAERKWLAARPKGTLDTSRTIVTPRWGFVLQLVLRGVEANKVRASILAKLELIFNFQFLK